MRVRDDADDGHGVPRYAQAVTSVVPRVLFVTSQKNGVSALGLQRVLGLGSYETAWTWLHKLRQAMVRPGRDRLTGAVEVDEIYIGGREKSARGRETGTKSIVVAAVEKNGRGGAGCRLGECPSATVSTTS